MNVGIIVYLEFHKARLNYLPQRCSLIMNICTTTISGSFNRKPFEGMLLKNIDELQEQD